MELSKHIYHYSIYEFTRILSEIVFVPTIALTVNNHWGIKIC